MELGQIAIKSSAVGISQLALVYVWKGVKIMHTASVVTRLVASLRGCSPLVLRRRQLKNVTNDGAQVPPLDRLFQSLTQVTILGVLVYESGPMDDFRLTSGRKS